MGRRQTTAACPDIAKYGMVGPGHFRTVNAKSTCMMQREHAMQPCINNSQVTRPCKDYMELDFLPINNVIVRGLSSTCTRLHGNFEVARLKRSYDQNISLMDWMEMSLLGTANLNAHPISETFAHK